MTLPCGMQRRTPSRDDSLDLGVIGGITIMAIEIQERAPGIAEVHATGKLSEEDYLHFVPELERLIKEYGKISILFLMDDFHGWNAGALWEDLKFDLKHFADIERLAMVREKSWQKGMSNFCRPFTTAKIRYFDHKAADAAVAWIESR